MAKKRFTDIEIWDKEWYMDLSPKHKCLMKYIFDKCDACGCWKPNWKLASLHIGEDVNFSDLSKLPKDQYEVLENGKIYIIDFIKFQYGTLSEKSPAHKPVFLAIEKNNLSDRVLGRVLDTLQEKDIYMDKEEEKEKEEEIHPKKNFNTKPIASDFNGLPETHIEGSIQYIKLTKYKDVGRDFINGLWDVFKIKNLTGKEYYQNEEKVYKHFMDTLKFQNFDNGTNRTTAKHNSKQQGAYELLDRLKGKTNPGGS